MRARVVAEVITAVRWCDVRPSCTTYARRATTASVPPRYATPLHRYLPRDQFHLVKSPFPFFVGSLVEDFQFVPEGVTFVTVMLDLDKVIPPLSGGGDCDAVDLPMALKLPLVARMTAEYRSFAGDHQHHQHQHQHHKHHHPRGDPHHQRRGPWRPDLQVLQPHLLGSMMAEQQQQDHRELSLGHLLSFPGTPAPANLAAALERAAHAQPLAAARSTRHCSLAAGLRAASAVVTTTVVHFFSVHDIFHSLEPEALAMLHGKCRFAVRCSECGPLEEQTASVEKLRTVEFYQRLVTSQNYQLFKEAALLGDVRLQAFVEASERESHVLLRRIVQEQACA